jgi:predicted phage baseplate assembly protein
MAPPAGTAATPVLIRTIYRVGGGTEGNLSANSAFRAASSPMAGVIREARNPLAAAGGASAEDIDRARLFAPRLFRTQERAVTASDYVDLAMQVPGVGKAQATAVSWNRVVLAIAPAGGVTEPSELLVRDVLGLFETRRMASVQLKVVGPDPVDVFVALTVHAQPYFLKSDVEAATLRALEAYLAFDAVSFGQTLFLSRVYDVVQELPQVLSLNVTQFTRSAAGAIDRDGLIALAPSELPRLAAGASGRITVIGGRPR